MKSIIKLVFILMAAVVVQSCDKIEAPYKKDVVVVPPVGPNAVQKVLVEDFTGHKCGNCPRATKAIYDLKAIYGDRLIILGLHAGTYATVFPAPTPFNYDFRNPVSIALFNDFGIASAGNPNGLVNRRTVNGDIVIAPTKWGEEVANVLNSTAPVPVKMTISNTFDSGSRALTAEVTSEFLSTLSGTHKLSVYMVEDSIVNWQRDYDVTPNDIPDYQHKEFLRGSMNGTYGDVVSETTAGTTSTLSFTSILDANWNENKFSIIAFIYNEATREIVQVEQVHVEP